MNQYKPKYFYSVLFCAAVLALAFASAADAQSLQTYFNFTTYGTRSGGAALADLTGHTTATLNKEAHTTLTGSGLTISAGGSSLNTGVTIGSAAMSGFTGAFSIQQWVTLAAVNNNQVLFGANNGDVNTYVGIGGVGPGDVSTVIGAERCGSISAYVGGSTPSYVRGGYGVADNSGTPSTATLYDVVLTYDGTNFNEYVNGTLKGTLNMPTFGSLAQACSADNWGFKASSGKGGFVIGGGMNDPFTDPTLPETTSDFLLYNGALRQAQIISIHNLGAGASLSAINGVLALNNPLSGRPSNNGTLVKLSEASTPHPSPTPIAAAGTTSSYQHNNSSRMIWLVFIFLLFVFVVFVVRKLIKNASMASDQFGNSSKDSESESNGASLPKSGMSREQALKLFGLEDGCSPDEIKKAYREECKKWNIDQRQHYEQHVRKVMEERFKDVNEAKDLLLGKT